ncbi:MAG TPA: class I SAM-dependent methyltransferase, partial [Polyangiales bacterium]|nr:class I SAM-dependent methyltransferase [Polyangiales bacterium]
KKVRLMRQTLDAYNIGSGARGLDLGCGQGWYLGEMRAAGYAVDGSDYSQGQLDKAKLHLSRAGVDQGALIQADAQHLPFADGSYDFVYSINAIHHMLEPGAQARALLEIVRVLRPGGIFMLHEINTYNPVFRWYVGYLYPLLKKIDEGNEEWVLPTELPATRGAAWSPVVEYFTFLPDFVPRVILNLLAGVERALENSSARRMSAHYQACLVKTALAER